MSQRGNKVEDSRRGQILRAGEKMRRRKDEVSSTAEEVNSIVTHSIQNVCIKTRLF